MVLTTNPHLATRLKKQYSYTVIPSPGLTGLLVMLSSTFFCLSYSVAHFTTIIIYEGDSNENLKVRQKIGTLPDLSVSCLHCYSWCEELPTGVSSFIHSFIYIP